MIVRLQEAQDGVRYPRAMRNVREGPAKAFPGRAEDVSRIRPFAHEIRKVGRGFVKDAQARVQRAFRKALLDRWHVRWPAGKRQIRKVCRARLREARRASRSRGDYVIGWVQGGRSWE